MDKKDAPKDAPSSSDASSSKDPKSSGKPSKPKAAVPPGKKHLVKELTENLLHTYKEINRRYYEKKRRRAAEQKAQGRNSSYDYRIRTGEILDGRYRIVNCIGKGSFGQVVRAWDNKDSVFVAIKIIKNKEAFRNQAKTEIQLLNLLNDSDALDQWCIVKLLGVFHHCGHTCLVFEMLSFNLYELLRKTEFRGVSLNLIRKFARQILKTLAYLSLDDINVIHCDLKPENILFRNPNRSAIKVIDFGSSCKTNERMYTYIQSRFYRSPEVILGLPYGKPIDMWSLGCILVEMHTGTPLFCGRDQADQMRRFVALKGQPPKSMLDNGRKRSHYFEHVTKRYDATDSDASTSDSDDDDLSGSSTDDDVGLSTDSEAAETTATAAAVPTGAGGGAGAVDADGDTVMADAKAKRSGNNRTTRSRSGSNGSGRKPTRQRVVEYYRLKPYTSTSHSHREPPRSLEKVLGVNTGGPKGRRQHEAVGHSVKHYRHFLDLVEQMLEYDPAKRIRPMQALNHPFLREDIVAAIDKEVQAEKAANAQQAGTEAGTDKATAAAAAAAAAAATTAATEAAAGKPAAGTGSSFSSKTTTATGSATGGAASGAAPGAAAAVAGGGTGETADRSAASGATGGSAQHKAVAAST